MKPRKVLKSWPLPMRKTYAEGEKLDPLPPGEFFGKDDFMRARFYSGVIERYATRAETELIVSHARDNRMPGMSFADTLEAMGSYLHMGPRDAKDKLIENTKKPKEQLEREHALTAAVREVMKNMGADSTEIFKVFVSTMQKLYPVATQARILAALEAGNTRDGFSVPAVIEAMALTQDVEPKCPECHGKTVTTRGAGSETQFAVCSLWKTKGHLDANEIEMRVRELRKALRPSGRMA